MDNNINIGESTNTNTVEVTNTPKIEVAPIKNGVVQEVVTETKLVDEQPPVNDKKLKDKKWFIIAIACVCLVIVIAIVIAVIIVNGVKKNAPKAGEIKDNYLVYADPVKGETVNYDVSDNLTIVLKITDVDVQEDIGTLVTYSLNVKNGSDKINDRSVWLTDDNKMEIFFESVGDNAIFKSENATSDGGTILNVLSSNGKLTELSNYGTNNTEFIQNYLVTDDSLIIYATRVRGINKISYDSNSIQNQDISQELSDGISICSDEITYIDSSTVVSETYTYSLTNGILDFDNPVSSDKMTLAEYISNNKEIYCQ